MSASWVVVATTRSRPSGEDGSEPQALITAVATIAQAKQKPDALAGLERWKSRHPARVRAADVAFVFAQGANSRRQRGQARRGGRASGGDRGLQGRRYSLACCLSLVVCAVLAGCKGLRECAQFAANLTQPQLEALRTWRNPRTKRHQAPKYGTLWRTVRGVDEEELMQVVNQWFRDQGMEPTALALDGKVLRATLQNEEGAVAAVSAFPHAGTPLFSIRSSLPQRDRRSPESKS